eukprot:4664007-Amphidinium_carterae.1
MFVAATTCLLAAPTPHHLLQGAKAQRDQNFKALPRTPQQERAQKKLHNSRPPGTIVNAARGR